MYEGFGAVVDEPAVEFRLFLPDSDVDPTQYTRGGSPRIRSVRVVGDFQTRLGQTAWDETSGLVLDRQPHPNGWLYSRRIDALPDGYYEYKYFVEFENRTTRWCGDPCSKYGGSDHENSGFVLGGNDTVVHPIARRLPLSDLVLYELMLDDFTAEFRGTRAPLDAVWDRLDHLQALGVNAIAFMPWTAWPGGAFSWGYDPFAFFSVEHRYYTDPANDLDKLFRLKALVNELHRRNIHVLMDGVFNHVSAGRDPNRGFPYFWLYENPAESPFVGAFEGGGFFEDLDYDNACTAAFITDACKYWLDDYAIDGIRFDYAKGFLGEGKPPAGISRMVAELDAHLAQEQRPNVSLILELLTDNRYAAVGLTNRVGATGCWYDPLMWNSFDAGHRGHVSTPFVRALNSGKDFEPGRRPVTYVENHDHSTLTEQCGGRDRWWRTQPLAIALLTACGAPMIHNGQEFGEQYWFPEDGPGRVMARPLRWARATDDAGARLLDLYRRLIAIRAAHPGLRTRNFYPDPYDERDTRFNAAGYGLDEDMDVAIFHRWGTGGNGRLERFIVVLNLSAFERVVDVPFSVNGEWQDLLNGGGLRARDFWARNLAVGSHWGRVLFRAD
jgi:1,4-alpha-glucan branching enzyme